MLRVNAHGIFLGVSFHRELIEGNPDTDAVRATYCNLHSLAEDGKTKAIIARTRARCGKRDNFSLETGRKVALKRALAQLGVPRAERAKVWLAYHNRPRPVSKAKVKVLTEEQSRTILEGSPSIPKAIHTLDLNAGEMA